MIPVVAETLELVQGRHSVVAPAEELQGVMPGDMEVQQEAA